MLVNVRLRDLPPSPLLVEHVRRRADFALGRFAPRIATVHVVVSHDHGPRAGSDKRCRITARIAGYGSLTASSSDAYTRDAVDRAFARLARAVARTIGGEARAHRRSWPLEVAS
ncbi:MAG: HPF/RaiA family ribosome-associated protein [Nannocystaceae bacterium]|nr:HPF/RaiA family ribosome-associated protein [Nannocystaceae bacterium]